MTPTNCSDAWNLDLHQGFYRPSGTPAVNEKTLSEIAEIEDAQAALRESIEATKQLAERAEDLLQKHKARTGSDETRTD